MNTFNPQYLKELRIKHRHTLDEGLVEYVKQEILKANLAGKERVELAFRTDSAWKSLVKHFEGLGFWVGSSGYVDSQYDEDDNEVYWFIFNWHIKVEGE